MAYVDVREEKSFDIARGWDVMDRDSNTVRSYNTAPAGSPPAKVIEGEPLRSLGDNNALLNNEDAWVVDDAADHIVGMLTGADNLSDAPKGISFDEYTYPEIVGNASPSALFLQKVTVLKGKFEADFSYTTPGAFFNLGTKGFAAPQVGLDVVIFNNIARVAPDHTWEYACLNNDSTTRYAGLAAGIGGTELLRNMVDRSVIGKVVAVSATKVRIRFDI